MENVEEDEKKKTLKALLEDMDQETKDLVNRLNESKEDLENSKLSIRALLQEEFFKTKFYIIGKWSVGLVLFFSVALWIGGTVFSTFEMKSMHEQALKVMSMTSDFQKRVEERIAKITEEIEEIKNDSQVAIQGYEDEIKILAENSKGDITEYKEKIEDIKNKVEEGKYISTLNGYVDKVEEIKNIVVKKDYVSHINDKIDDKIDDDIELSDLKLKVKDANETYKTKVKELNEVFNKEELNEILAQIDALRVDSGELKLRNIRFFVNYLTLVVLVISIGAIILCLLTIFKVKSKAKNNQTTNSTK